MEFLKIQSSPAIFYLVVQFCMLTLKNDGGELQYFTFFKEHEYVHVFVFIDIIHAHDTY